MPPLPVACAFLVCWFVPSLFLDYFVRIKSDQAELPALHGLLGGNRRGPAEGRDPHPRGRGAAGRVADDRGYPQEGVRGGLIRARLPCACVPVRAFLRSSVTCFLLLAPRRGEGDGWVGGRVDLPRERTGCG